MTSLRTSTWEASFFAIKFHLSSFRCKIPSFNLFITAVFLMCRCHHHHQFMIVSFHTNLGTDARKAFQRDTTFTLTYNLKSAFTVHTIM